MPIRTFLASLAEGETMSEEPTNDQTWKELATSLKRVADLLERIERPLQTIADSLVRNSEERLRRSLIDIERKRKKW
jgi:hypothetical protein